MISLDIASHVHSGACSSELENVAWPLALHYLLEVLCSLFPTFIFFLSRPPFPPSLFSKWISSLHPSLLPEVPQNLLWQVLPQMWRVA
jgi:hypothetical protein